MMVEVVESGTGKLAKIRGLPIAGKTGTATKPLPGGGGYSSDRFMSSFLGFFPADDPIYTILVSLDEPQGSLYYSSDIAAPVFQKIVYDVIDALKAPDHQSPEPLIYRSWKMPSFIGLTVKDVIDLCSDMGIDLSKISVVGSGLVKQQYPAPETPIEWVDEVIVHLGK
jgi:cell division protein FtsI (penicillin-binding protein 3)